MSKDAYQARKDIETIYLTWLAMEKVKVRLGTSKFTLEQLNNETKRIKERGI